MWIENFNSSLVNYYDFHCIIHQASCLKYFLKQGGEWMNRVIQPSSILLNLNPWPAPQLHVHVDIIWISWHKLDPLTALKIYAKVYVDVSVVYGGSVWLNIWKMIHLFSNKRARKEQKWFFFKLPQFWIPFLTPASLSYVLLPFLGYDYWIIGLIQS